MSHLPQLSRSIIALALVSTAATSAYAQSFQGIGDLPGGTSYSVANGISADGSTVVGMGTTAAGTEAVYWRNGNLVSLGDLAGGPVESTARSTNADGSIIVGSGKDATADRPVRWNGPAYTLTQLAQPNGFSGGAHGTGISADGQTLCGWATDNQTTAYNNVAGFRIDNGVMTGLGVPVQGSGSDSGAYATNSDGSVVVGRVRISGFTYQGCYWVASTFHLPPDLAGGTDYSQTFGVSANGKVLVGSSCSTAAPTFPAGEPCRWQNDVPVGLGAAPGGMPQGNAYSANFDGSVIVGSTNAASGNRAFIWDAAHGLRELSNVLNNDYGIALAGWTLLAATAITPDGSAIIGVGTNALGDTEGWIARIPCAAVSTYCVAKTNSLGCVPAIGGSGIASATANSGFLVKSINMRNNKAGLLLYSTTGSASVPFSGGTLCVAAPVRRTPGINSGGSPTGSDCTGVFSVDFNAFARGLLGGTPLAALSIPGTAVACQFWGRDPGFVAPQNTQLSNGLRFVICD